MKSNLWIAAIALLLVAGSSFTAARAAAPATMNVGTYNIWCGVHDDGRCLGKSAASGSPH